MYMKMKHPYSTHFKLKSNRPQRQALLQNSVLPNEQYSKSENDLFVIHVSTHPSEQ